MVCVFINPFFFFLKMSFRWKFFFFLVNFKIKNVFGIILLYYSKTVFTKTFLETKNCFAFKLRYFWRARWREKKNPIRHFRNTKWGTHGKWNFKYATKTKSMLQIHIHNIRTASKLIPIIVDFLFPKSNSNSCLFSNFYYELCACPVTSHFNNGFGIMATIVKIQLLFHLPLQCGKFDFKRKDTALSTITIGILILYPKLTDSRAGILVETVLISYVWHWVPESVTMSTTPPMPWRKSHVNLKVKIRKVTRRN